MGYAVGRKKHTQSNAMQSLKPWVVIFSENANDIQLETQAHKLLEQQQNI